MNIKRGQEYLLLSKYLVTKNELFKIPIILFLCNYIYIYITVIYSVIIIHRY